MSPRSAKREVGTGNFPAVPFGQAANFYKALTKREGMAARALEFSMLCASRSGEVRGATWGEIDLKRAVWEIPASRMKAGKEHRVPLSEAAVALLEALPRQEREPGDNRPEFVFWAPRGGMLSDMSLSAVMRRMHEAEAKAGRLGWLDRVSGRPAVPHGLRSTFRDWVAEATAFPSDLAEAALAHTLGNSVQGAYQRGDRLQKRRKLMAAWADHLTGAEAGMNVVSIAS